MSAFIPIAYFCTSVSLGAVALRALPRDSLGLLGLSISLALLTFRRVTDLTSWAELSSLLGFFILLWISHLVKLLVLDDASSPSGRRDTYNILFDFRGVQARKQNAKKISENPNTNVTVSSSGENARKSAGFSKASGHRAFLLKRLVSVVGFFLLNQVYTIAYSLLLQLSYDDFHPLKQNYLRRIRTVTTREIAIRSWMVFHFIWSSCAIFTATHDILAIAHIAIGIDEPEDWPSLYGSIAEAYSIRKFWGKFWHPLVQRSYAAYGSFLSQKIMNLPPGSFADRTCVNFCIFLISGIVHACITVQLGFKCGYWEDVEFFLICYAALLAEEGVQRAGSRVFGRLWQNGWICRGLGYTWVFGFLFWVLPKHQYPKVLCTPA